MGCNQSTTATTAGRGGSGPAPLESFTKNPLVGKNPVVVSSVNGDSDSDSDSDSDGELVSDRVCVGGLCDTQEFVAATAESDQPFERYVRNDMTPARAILDQLFPDRENR